MGIAIVRMASRDYRKSLSSPNDDLSNPYTSMILIQQSYLAPFTSQQKNDSSRPTRTNNACPSPLTAAASLHNNRHRRGDQQLQKEP